MKVICFILISLSLLIIIEFLKRRLILSTVVSRRVAHLGAGAINIVAPLFVSPIAIIIANLGFAGLLLAGRGTNYFSSIQTAKRRTYGDVYFPLGIVAAAVLFLPEYTTAFQYGVAIMGVADALAGLVGERWGKKRSLLGIPKTVEGATTFYLSSLLITLIFVPHIGLAVFLLPPLLTAVEFGLIYGLDNLVLPTVASGLFLFLL